MKVLALTRTSTIGPSSRYRIAQYASLLEREGISIEALPLFGPTWFAILGIRNALLRVVAKSLYSAARLAVRSWQVLRAAAGRADLVLVEQQYFPYLPAAIESLLWIRSKPTILEFDDAIYLTAGHEAKLRRLCGLATLVIVGNRFLQEFAAPYARKVVVISTMVDPEQYGPRPVRDDGLFRVAWIGLPYNLGYLDELAAPLAALEASGVACELRIISSALPEDVSRFEGIEPVLRPWSEETEAAELAACDVGVMPLPDTPWARGKCGLKLLQYMAAGLPVVASPVGVNADIIEPGENGLLASTADEWSNALRRIATEPGLADRLGAEGRRTVERDYAIERGARSIAETYRLACAAANPGAPA